SAECEHVAVGEELHVVDAGVWQGNRGAVGDAYDGEGVVPPRGIGAVPVDRDQPAVTRDRVGLPAVPALGLGRRWGVVHGGAVSADRTDRHGPSDLLR